MVSPVHPLSTDIAPPKRFTYPFCYEPHPLCILAAEEVKREIARIQPKEGKMFGVLVVTSADGSFLTSVTPGDGVAFLAAYSGLLEGRNDWDYFVPPVFDAQQPDGYFKTKEREIMQSEAHKQMSQELQLWLFRQYQMLNARGEVKDLVEIWQDYHRSPRIRNKYPLPPGGTGDCCAPKLLQYAYQHGLKPVCMAEFWWGASPVGEVRHHGHFYPACRSKCKPILDFMLQGLDVEHNPLEQPQQDTVLDTVYDDRWLTVLNKPSGMLTVPGKALEDSLLTRYQAAHPEAHGPIVVHRLDQETSGLVIFAKDKATHKALQQQFEQHTVSKRYIALLDGLVMQDEGVIDLPLLPDVDDRPRQRVDHEHGRPAVTRYRVLERNDGVTRIGLEPLTGRTHQLRVHASHPLGLNCPIVGDRLYGRAASRLMLHAQSITFAHPATGETFSLTCSPDF